MIKQKGQGLVELAISLLIAIPFFIGGYLVFMLSYDYMTIAALARESARALAVQTSSNMPTARATIIEDKMKGNASLGAYYSWKPNPAAKAKETDDFLWDYGAKSGTDVQGGTETIKNPYVRVAITAHRKQGGLVDIFGVMPNTIQASSTMYWEQYTNE